MAAQDAHGLGGARTIRLILLFGLLVSVFSYGLIFVSSSYLRHVSVDAAVSFWSNDFPRPLPADAYPSPFGNHFFGDFLIPFRLAQQSSPYLAEGFLPFGYFPMAAVLLGPLSLLDYWWAFSFFLLVSVIPILGSIWRSFPSDEKVAAALLISLVFISGPFVNAVDRGNVGLLMVSIMCLGALAELSGRRILAGVFFGIAVAMKLYPAFLGAVFIRRERWKALVAMAVTSLACVFVPMIMYEGGWWKNLIAMKNQFAGSSNFSHAERIHAFNNSFFALFHAIELSEVPVIHWLGKALVHHYYAVVAVVALISLVVTLNPRVTSLSKYVCCCVTMVFSPNIVGSYVLLIMVVPLILGCAMLSRSSSAPSRQSVIQIVLLVLLLIPKGLPFPNPLATWTQQASTFASVLNPLIGLLLVSVSAVEFFRTATNKVLVHAEGQNADELPSVGTSFH